MAQALPRAGSLGPEPRTQILEGSDYLMDSDRPSQPCGREPWTALPPGVVTLLDLGCPCMWAVGASGVSPSGGSSTGRGAPGGGVSPGKGLGHNPFTRSLSRRRSPARAWWEWTVLAAAQGLGSPPAGPPAGRASRAGPSSRLTAQPPRVPPVQGWAPGLWAFSETLC